MDGLGPVGVLGSSGHQHRSGGGSNEEGRSSSEGYDLAEHGGGYLFTEPTYPLRESVLGDPIEYSLPTASPFPEGGELSSKV